MSQTIIELSDQIAEIEKRIKAVTSSQSTLTNIIAIRDCIDSIQNYLSTLNTEFEGHTTICSEYSTQILTINSQISTINSTLENLNTTPSVDLTEINTTISTIESSLSTLQTELNILSTAVNDFLGTSTTSVSALETDISTLQTEIGTIEDSVDSNTADISTLNTSVGEIQTTINNVSSAQNSLTSAQNSLTSTVTGINTRLATAENNISALTGGIDVGEISQDINNLENYNEFHSHTSSGISCFGKIISGTTVQYTRPVYFSVLKQGVILFNITLNYTSTGSGTLTVKVYQDYPLIYEDVIDLSLHPQMYTISFSYNCLSSYTSDIFLSMESTSMVSFGRINYYAVGEQVSLFSNSMPYVVNCYNNNVYITKNDQTQIKYGKFAYNHVNLNNLSNIINQTDIMEGASIYDMVYGAFPTVNATFTDSKEVKIYYTCNKKIKMSYNDENSTTELGSNLISTNLIHEFDLASYNYPTATIISAHKPIFMEYIENDRTYHNYTNISNFLSGRFYYCTPVKHNYMGVGSTPLSINNMISVALYEDGYFYLLKGKTLTETLRIGTGEYATAYEEPSEQINIYLTRSNAVYRYRLTPNATGSYLVEMVEKFNNTRSIIELVNRYALRLEMNYDLTNILISYQ